MSDVVRTLRFHADHEEARLAQWREKHPNARLSHDGIMMFERVDDLRAAADEIERLMAEQASLIQQIHRRGNLAYTNGEWK